MHMTAHTHAHMYMQTHTHKSYISLAEYNAFDLEFDFWYMYNKLQSKTRTHLDMWLYCGGKSVISLALVKLPFYFYYLLYKSYISLAEYNAFDLEFDFWYMCNKLQSKTWTHLDMWL